MYYVKTKRGKIGRCNICSKEKRLSWDHVPPKGGITLSTMEMESLFRIFTSKEEAPKILESQNGLKFRTICKECNEFLGQKYDVAVNEFAISIGRYLKSNLHFPPTIHHRVKPIPLIKGVLGHLLAAKHEYDESLFDQQVRSFILDETSQIPEEIKVFFWIYPYNCTIVMRDFGMPAVRGKLDKMGFFQTLKYFPVAFLATDLQSYEGLDELTRFRILEISDEVEIPINLRRVKHQYWPEMVDDGNILFGGQAAANSIAANPKRK